MMFSSAGPGPACVAKYAQYLWTTAKAAEVLIPDARQRENEINQLGTLT